MLTTIHAATLALTVMAAALPPPSASAAPADPPTVAVLEFDFTAVSQGLPIERDLGRGIADLITDGVVNDGAFRVIECRIGRHADAQYLIVGSVIRFGTEESKRGVGGLLFRKALGGGLISRTKGKAAVGITARLVDATSGVVVASVKGDGVSSRKGFLLGGLGGGGVGTVNMRSDAFRETILGEATETAVRQVIDGLVAARSRVPRP